MHPELFNIPFFNVPVHSYGLMLVLGLLSAMELAKYLARRSGLNPDHFATASILALVFGLIGARIAYVIQNFDEFTRIDRSFSQNLFDAINLTTGGLVYYGGFLFAFAALVLWAVRKSIPLFRAMDIIAPCLMIGLAFGRVGCFLNGCCWGQHCEAESAVAVSFPYHSPAYMDDYEKGKITPDPRLFSRDPALRTERLLTPKEIAKHPDLVEIASKEHAITVINTQLISTATASLIALVCVFAFTLYWAPGRVFALMMMLEGVTRTLIEGLRVEPKELGSLTLSQVIGIGVFVGGIVLWFAATKVRAAAISAKPGYPENASHSPSTK